MLLFSRKVIKNRGTFTPTMPSCFPSSAPAAILYAHGRYREVREKIITPNSAATLQALPSFLRMMHSFNQPRQWCFWKASEFKLLPKLFCFGDLFTVFSCWGGWFLSQWFVIVYAPSLIDFWLKLGDFDKKVVASRHQSLFQRQTTMYSLKTNMSSENQWLEDDNSFKMVPFQGTCLFSGV